ncbi:MAG: agmatinase [Epulopiscium sp. Nele67-Bin002]|nr:MAG: agmatinase [Epulopiscium sp. Nele67-Bin002]OON94942.1 MAG: agmatinase [Epulopiscium sp. Nele67-Bin001]
MLNTYQSTNFIGCDKSFEEAKIVMVGAPFDGTVSFRPGTRFAPSQIRLDSYGLETYSPYLDLDLEDYAVADIGDIEFPFGNTTKVLDSIKETISRIVAENKKPFTIGGEHLISLPALEAVVQKYPDLRVIHFDAHTDLRDEYLGEKLSHATVIKRIWDILGDNKIFQFGIRSGTKQEFEWAKEHTHLNKFDISTLQEAVDTITEYPIYLTIDLDVLDPSIFSGTGTPEPGGLQMKEFLYALRSLKYLNIVGADVVELSPHYDTSGVSTSVACKVIREVLLLMSKTK